MKANTHICDPVGHRYDGEAVDGASDALTSLVRLLACQAAREWVEAQLGALPLGSLTLAKGGANG